jgi:hypothetical protein
MKKFHHMKTGSYTDVGMKTWHIEERGVQTALLKLSSSPCTINDAVSKDLVLLSLQHPTAEDNGHDSRRLITNFNSPSPTYAAAPFYSKQARHNTHRNRIHSILLQCELSHNILFRGHMAGTGSHIQQTFSAFDLTKDRDTQRWRPLYGYLLFFDSTVQARP